MPKNVILISILSLLLFQCSNTDNELGNHDSVESSQIDSTSTVMLVDLAEEKRVILETKIDSVFQLHEKEEIQESLGSLDKHIRKLRKEARQSLKHHLGLLDQFEKLIGCYQESIGTFIQIRNIEWSDLSEEEKSFQINSKRERASTDEQQCRNAYFEYIQKLKEND